MVISPVPAGAQNADEEIFQERHSGGYPRQTENFLKTE
jgi:hypothetical protein